ncbi:MAG: hypothetical protein ACK415_09915 [Thermodesulfovibrionales bacterium]
METSDELSSVHLPQNNNMAADIDNLSGIVSISEMEKALIAIEWPSVGLPDDFLPLLAPDRMAFIKEEDKIVGHGRISIEELIVPFVNILRK